MKLLPFFLLISFISGLYIGQKGSYWKGVHDGVYSTILISIEETEIASAR